MPIDERLLRLRREVDSLQRLRQEHRALLCRIAEDAGMEPATRRMLLEHALEEEDERVERLCRLLEQLAPGSVSTLERQAQLVPSKPPNPSSSARSEASQGRLRCHVRLGSLRSDA